MYSQTNEHRIQKSIIMFILTTIVAGLMQIGPNMCQVDLLHPDNTIDTFVTKCELIISPDLL